MKLQSGKYYLNKHNVLLKCMGCEFDFCTNYARCNHLILEEVPFKAFISFRICPKMSSLEGVREATKEEVLIHLL